LDPLSQIGGGPPRNTEVTECVLGLIRPREMRAGSSTEDVTALTDRRSTDAGLAVEGEPKEEVTAATAGSTAADTAGDNNRLVTMATAGDFTVGLVADGTR
jgi:hypothetical protein